MQSARVSVHLDCCPGELLFLPLKLHARAAPRDAILLSLLHLSRVDSQPVFVLWQTRQCSGTSKQPMLACHVTHKRRQRTRAAETPSKHVVAFNKQSIHVLPNCEQMAVPVAAEFVVHENPLWQHSVNLRLRRPLDELQQVLRSGRMRTTFSCMWYSHTDSDPHRLD